VDEAERLAADLRIRHGAKAVALPFNATDFDSHGPLLDACAERLGGPLDGVILCHGIGGGGPEDQAAAERDPAFARAIIDTNYTASVCLLNLAAERLEAATNGREGGGGRGGFLCAVSSVAGDRGRPSNFIYGSSKAALNAYLEGLRARLARKGIAVITIKPGFVDTAATWGLLRGGPLVADPQKVGVDVVRAIRRGSAVVYTPRFWRLIMAIIRAIPRPVFHRMKL
jgi:decaprenylphospho-beta-D-erythro-pentofuranosid-2-ulose 2-reductase